MDRAAGDAADYVAPRGEDSPVRGARSIALARAGERIYLSTKMKRPTRSAHKDASAGTAAAQRSRRPTPVAQSSALKLNVVLARAASAVARHAERDITRHGLSPAEFGVLEVLYHKGPLLLGEVQRKILVSSGGVTYLVDRLVARGLVERQECPDDRRARYAALTPDGQALIARIFPEHARVIERSLAGLTSEEQQRATELLRKLGLAAAASLGETIEL
jgi:MarR family transcriptional regulator, 2-MHQ and catechol-resistance regulon repressor